MTTLSTMAFAGSVLLLAGGAAGAQVKTIEGESISKTVTIEAIEQSTRTVTVKDDKGIYETIYAPAEMKRFSELKVGDKITARYYENVVVRLKKPGEAAVDVGLGGADSRRGAETRRDGRPAAHHHRNRDGDGSQDHRRSRSGGRTAMSTAGRWRTRRRSPC